MNKQIYLGLLILKISQRVMYEFSSDFTKSKYQDKANLCYMDTSSFTVNIKLMMFINSFQMMLKKDLTHQTMKLKDPYQYIKTKM